MVKTAQIQPNTRGENVEITLGYAIVIRGKNGEALYFGGLTSKPSPEFNSSKHVFKPCDAIRVYDQAKSKFKDTSISLRVFGAGAALSDDDLRLLRRKNLIDEKRLTPDEIALIKWAQK